MAAAESLAKDGAVLSIEYSRRHSFFWAVLRWTMDRSILKLAKDGSEGWVHWWMKSGPKMGVRAWRMW